MNYLHIFYMPTRIKLFGFFRDKYAYIAVGVFGPAFIAFYAGAFLVDYDSDKLPKGAQLASYVVGGPFVLLFSMINLQATITFIALVALFMIIICIVCIGGGSSEKLRDKFVRPASWAEHTRHKQLQLAAITDVLIIINRLVVYIFLTLCSLWYSYAY